MDDWTEGYPIAELVKRKTFLRRTHRRRREHEGGAQRAFQVGGLWRLACIQIRCSPDIGSNGFRSRSLIGCMVVMELRN